MRQIAQQLVSVGLVGLGGYAGSILRYLVCGWVQRLADTPLFPYGTLSVNVVGCLTIGLLGGWADNAGLFRPLREVVPVRRRPGRVHDVFHIWLRDDGAAPRQGDARDVSLRRSPSVSGIWGRGAGVRIVHSEGMSHAGERRAIAQDLCRRERPAGGDAALSPED